MAGTAARADVVALIPRASSARISRRALLSGFALGAAGLALSACSRQTAFGASARPDGVIEGQLNVYSWGDYDDPGNISAFQKASGVTVQLDSYGSNEEMIAKLGATRGTSGYDIVVPTGNYVPMMVANGLLQKLDHSRLKNLGNLEAAYTNQSWDRGNVYTVCKDWGTTGFAYDTNVITRPMTSWADFLDAAQKEASRNVAVLEDPWEVTSMYFAANGIDPNTTEKAHLDAAEKYLVGTLAPHLKAFNSTAVTSGIPEGTFALIQAFNGDARQGMLASGKIPKNWKFVYPTPTANLWMDTWAIATGAQHPDAAYAFIDAILEPDAAYREVDYIGYSTGVKGLRQRAEKEKFDLPELVFPSDEVIARLTPAELNDAAERLVQIVNRMMAKAGS
ncbi:spermidine/putrescine ABC transporter substrate-binding protein [Leifsonia shinshuensis]|uniref:polyamine ABC transporter substrate-binding protein n=1 Tax=Leifsonia shinshuensis TaxID=150026 RepID=UPI001F50FE00|nr:spermidine/putrescine ABC transporter substrate-binding protein [Leifsonia shinshuensis]MCI0156020.1 spermidine/putrescine ABC transporter substrate-binding protein [Leifsonia shinshuensis]